MIEKILNCPDYKILKKVWDKEDFGELTKEDMKRFYFAKGRIKNREYISSGSHKAFKQAYKSFSMANQL